MTAGIGLAGGRLGAALVGSRVRQKPQGMAAVQRDASIFSLPIRPLWWVFQTRLLFDHRPQQ
jgi:hypothetical protein